MFRTDKSVDFFDRSLIPSRKTQFELIIRGFLWEKCLWRWLFDREKAMKGKIRYIGKNRKTKKIEWFLEVFGLIGKCVLYTYFRSKLRFYPFLGISTQRSVHSHSRTWDCTFVSQYRPNRFVYSVVYPRILWSYQQYLLHWPITIVKADIAFTAAIWFGNFKIAYLNRNSIKKAYYHSYRKRAAVPLQSKDLLFMSSEFCDAFFLSGYNCFYHESLRTRDLWTMP